MDKKERQERHLLRLKLKKEQEEKWRVLKILIDAGANVNARDNVPRDGGRTPLIMAA